jgi:Ribbon-helix-helix protein, copG family
MIQLAKEKRNAGRVMLSAFVDRSERQALAELARRQDRSVSSLVRLALTDYLRERRTP